MASMTLVNPTRTYATGVGGDPTDQIHKGLRLLWWDVSFTNGQTFDPSDPGGAGISQTAVPIYDWAFRRDSGTGVTVILGSGVFVGATSDTGVGRLFVWTRA